MAANNIRAVTYLRRSTDRQEASIPDQREAVEKLARQKGYRIVREYKDEGISGDDTERRADFRRMLDDATRLGDFDCVLCWDQDRFGRFDPLEAGYWIKPLRDRGVFLETVAQGRIDWEDFAGRIVYAVQQEGKHAYLRDLSRNVTRSMLARAKRGEWLGGRPPYGYRLNAAKRLEPSDPAEVETVRWLYREYLARDVGLCTLAKELNARGVPPPARSATARWRGGGLWAVQSVRNILIRPTYLGHTVWNRRHVGAYHTVRGGEIATSSKPRRRIVSNDRSEWVVFENTHEALVDRATFERVQQKLTARRDRSSSPSPGAPFLFTGLVKCGDCGWPMYGLHWRAGGKDGSEPRGGRKYICGQYHTYRRQGCGSNSVEERDLLDAALRTIEGHFLKPENLAALCAEIRRQEAEELAGAEPAAAALDRRITALAKKIDTGMERWLTAPPEMVADAGAKLEQWRKEREALEEQRRAVAKPAVTEAALDAAVKQITAGVATLRQRAGNADPAVLRDVLRNMLVKVVVDFKQVPYGRRMRGVPTGGTLYLRDDLVQCKPVPIAGPITKPMSDTR
jgi:DNA invertase Pin-like site-specific DNA recombinase